MKLTLDTILLFQFLLSTTFIKASIGSQHDKECVNSNSNESDDQTCSAPPNPNAAKEEEEWSCQFYLAPSSIPNAGFGVYTTKSITKYSPLKDPEAPSVMVYDGDSHHPLVRSGTWSMESYFWSGEGSGQFECSSVEEYVVNFGTSCNFHTYLKNVHPAEVNYDDTITPRNQGSPGIGAYSYHGGVKFIATRDIEAGEEIFADYGEEWLEERPYLKSIPRHVDYVQAAEVIAKLINGLDHGAIDGTFFLGLYYLYIILNQHYSVIELIFIPKKNYTNILYF